jgi:DNA-binding transcriptional regulator LsrR (DeoR family)
VTAGTHLLYKIAKAYYEDGLTQDQIGKRFGLSRIKVSRLLQQARDTRVVQITITPPVGSFADLERRLEEVYGLDEVVVVEAPVEDQAAIVHFLGQAAALYLTRCLNDGDVLDLSWGSTLRATVDAMTPQNLPGVRVVQMLGGLGRVESEVYGADLALRLAQALGAKVRLLPSPGIVASKLVRDALMQDVNIAETLELAAYADVALVGIGSPTPDSVVIQSGILSADELAGLRAAGAVGDIALRFFDATGRAVDHPLNERIVGLDLAQIRHIPRVIGVAGGPDKFAVIHGAVRGRLVDVLITDARTAQALLAAAVRAQGDRAPVAGMTNK